MKKDRKITGHSLGDLIVALYQEAGRVSQRPAGQRVMVCAALKHLLRTRVSSKHRISLQL